MSKDVYHYIRVCPIALPAFSLLKYQNNFLNYEINDVALAWKFYFSVQIADDRSQTSDAPVYCVHHISVPFTEQVYPLIKDFQG